jgi:hypothetical protein
LITAHLKKTIDNFKRVSIEMRPQSPVLGKQGDLLMNSKTILMCLNADEEDSFIGEAAPAANGMYSISGPQEPSDLPPSPTQPTITAPPRDQNNKISFDIDGSSDINDAKTGTEHAHPALSSPLSVKPLIPISPVTTPINSDTPSSKQKSRNRRFSDGIIFNTLRSITRWSPSASFRGDPERISASSNSVTPRSDIIAIDKDRPRSSSSGSVNHNMNVMTENDDVASILGKEESDIDADAMTVTRPSIDSTIDQLMAAASHDSAHDPNDKIQDVSGSFGNIDGLGIPEPFVDEQEANKEREEEHPYQDDCHGNADEIEEKEDPEASYYRIQQSFYKSNPNLLSSQASQPNLNRIHLQPKSSILALSNNTGATKNITGASRISTLMAKQRAAKTAHERLYLSACIAKERKSSSEKRHEDELVKDIKSTQFKMSEKSRNLSANKRRIMLPIPNSPNSGNFRGYTTTPEIPKSLHERLYVEAMYDKARFKKLADINEKLREDVPSDDYWSCSRCGTIHEIKRPVVTSLYTFTVREPDKSRVCSKCSWNQTNQSDFKPTNIGLSLLPDKNEIKEAVKRRKEQRKQQSMGMSVFGANDEDTSTPTIHDILYKDNQSLQSKLVYQQAIAQIHDKENTFHPSIPDTSKQVLRQKIEKESSQSLPDSPEFCTSSNEMKLGEYFSQAPCERLYKTKHLRLDSYLIQGQQNIEQDLQRSSSAGTLQSKKKNSFHATKTKGKDRKLSKKMQTLIDRLTNEFKHRDLKRMWIAKEYYSKDPITGKALFQPNIGPKPPSLQADQHHDSDALNVSNLHRMHRDIFEELYEEDDKKRAKQKKREETMKKEAQENLKKNQVQALPQSEAILRQSRQESIDELYRLLLATNTVVAYHRTYDVQVAQEELILHINQEANELLEHEEEENSWKVQAIDLHQVNLSLLVPSIQKLVHEVLVEKAASQPAKLAAIASSETSAPNLDGVVDYEDFTRLVLQAMKRREGTGKWYVIPPKVRHDTTIQKIREQQANHTYAPNINPISKNLSEAYREHHRGNGVRTTDALYHEAETFEYRRRSKKESLKAAEETELTFKPKLYRPPSRVKAKYRESAPANLSLYPSQPASPMKLESDQGSEANALYRRKLAEMRHISRSRSNSLNPNGQTVTQISSPVSSSRSPHRPLTPSGRKTEPSRSASASRPKVMDTKVESMKASQSMSRRPSSSSLGKTKRMSSYSLLHAPSSIPDPPHHTSSSSMKHHPPTLPYEKLRPPPPPSSHEKKSKVITVRVSGNSLAEPNDFMRYWGIDDLDPSDLNKFADSAISPKSLSSHPYHHHSSHALHDHRLSTSSSASIAARSPYEEPSHRSSQVSTAPSSLSNTNSSQESAAMSSMMSAHAAASKANSSSKALHVSHREETATAQETSDSAATLVRPSLSRRSSHPPAHAAPMAKRNTIHQRPSNDKLSLDIERDHSPDRMARAKSERLSLSSMLSSLIHGDTPKPIGKQLNLSPETSPTNPNALPK